jgi:CheY-like chemotaxis protein
MPRTLELLLIGDDAEGLTVLVSTARSEGHEVIPVTSAGEALDYAIINPVDAVLVAFPLQGSDAMVLPGQIRKQTGQRGLPCALLPSDTTPERTTTAFERGYTLVINRPQQATDALRFLKIIVSLAPERRRQFARVPFSQAVRCRHPRNEFGAQAVNLSEQGIMIAAAASRKFLRNRDALKLAFAIQQRAMEVDATAVSILPSGKVSLRFESLTADDRKLLRQYVESVRPREAKASKPPAPEWDGWRAN